MITTEVKYIYDGERKYKNISPILRPIVWPRHWVLSLLDDKRVIDFDFFVVRPTKRQIRQQKKLMMKRHAQEPFV